MMKKILAGIIFLIGFILSPFSWWNDILVNIPLAYFLAIPFCKISKGFFLFAFMFFYVMTNVIGIIMIRRSAIFLKNKEQKKYTKKQIKIDIIMMVIFTILIFILVKINI